MKNDLEIEFQLAEMLGFTDRSDRSRTQSLQKSTDALDGFFERLEIEKTLGCRAGEFEKLVAQRFRSSDDEPRAVTDLREFVKNRKPKSSGNDHTRNEDSMIHLLRKAADAMAGI